MSGKLEAQVRGGHFDAGLGTIPSRNIDVIIHIGLPKTGSSAIQKLCLENKAVLAEHSYCYPKHAIDRNGVSGGHSSLFKTLRDDGVDAFRQSLNTLLIKAKQKNQILLLSSEGLSQNPEELHEATKGLNVIIIAFFRHPVEAFFSAYNQMVKRHFFTKKIDDYAERAIRNVQPFLSGRHLFDWQQLFAENFILFPYLSSDKIEHNVVHKFFSCLGIQPARFPSDTFVARINSGYCLAALKLKRLMNLVLTEKDERINLRLDLFFQRISDAQTYDASSSDSLISEDAYDRLCNKFQADIAKLESAFAIDMCFKPSQCNKSVSSLKISAEMIEIMRLFIGEESTLYKRLRKRILAKTWFSDDADHKQLCELFDCHYVLQAREKNVFFTDKELGKMARFDRVDFLRETARLLMQRGDYKNAMLLISEAKRLRAGGPVIKRLYSQIQKLNES